MSDKHRFEIAIGDWSGDGHGHCECFVVESNKRVEDVREAYFKAKSSHAKVCPENLCDSYSNSVLSKRQRTALAEAGYTSLREDEFGPQDMARIVAWFCCLGDPELRIEIIPKEHLPTLHFYGFDKLGRSIDGWGYGLFI